MAESPDRVDDELAETGVLEGDSAAEKKQKLPAFIPVVAAALIAVGLGGYVSFSYYPHLAQAVGGFGQDSTPGDKPPTPRAYGQFSELDNVIINPAASDGQRFLMLSIGLEARSIDILDEVTLKEVVVRDTVLKVLGSRSVEELADISRRTELKESLRTAVNSILRKGEIDRLYFTRYVLQ